MMAQPPPAYAMFSDVKNSDISDDTMATTSFGGTRGGPVEYDGPMGTHSNSDDVCIGKCVEVIFLIG